MKKILVGTHNKGKFKEITYLLSKKYKKISPNTLKIPSPKETSKTFVGNSELKANFFSKFVDYPVISDDSGLCIKSLNNKPGIFSARLAKRKGSFFKAMNYILKKMKNKKNRSAYFICSLSFKDKQKKMVTKIGKIHGKIAQEISGKRGFGYDPIFIPKNYKITFGQMVYSKKLKIDHRFIAFKKLKRKIKIL
mgnify:CR=1 FL=1